MPRETTVWQPSFAVMRALRYRLWGRGLPLNNRPHVLSGTRIVRDAWKPPAQLNGGSELAIRVERGADSVSISFGDEEHRQTMVAIRKAGKLLKKAWELFYAPMGLPLARGSYMHTLAIIGGACLHLLGDIELCAAGVMAFRLKGQIADHDYEFSSRPAAAFELFPIPIGLLLVGLILGRWGFAGL
jgi:hypothetical protein